MGQYLISVCGPNGAGKSTFTRTILGELAFPVIDPDKISSQGISSIPAGKQAGLLVRQYLAQGISFIRESTLSSKFDCQIIRLAKRAGYRNVLIFLSLPTPEICIQRVCRRHMNGGHSIPQDIIIRRYWRGLKNLEHLQPIVDSCHILSASTPQLPGQEMGKILKLAELIKLNLWCL